MRCLNWNLEWKTEASKAGRLIQEKIAALNSDMACFTEVDRSMILEGHFIESAPDYGYPNPGGRRKVILWSKLPWTEADTVGDDEMPSGRFASGVIDAVRFVGVCIPWRDAHVSTGRKDRKAWEDHLSYCRGLGRALRRYASGPIPLCLVGDFNQRIPRANQPIEVAQALAEAIPPDFDIVTAGMKDDKGGALIDHFVVSRNVSLSITQIIPRTAPDGTKLSDHAAVVAFLRKRCASTACRPPP